MSKNIILHYCKLVYKNFEKYKHLLMNWEINSKGIKYGNKFISIGFTYIKSI